MSGREEVVVIPLGNRFRGDDGAGPAIADRLRGTPGCRIVEGVEDALAIIAAWENAGLAIVLDAALSGAPAGAVHRIEAGEGPLPRDLARCSSHGLGLAEAVELGRALNRLPARLVVYAIEAGDMGSGAGLSPPVAAVVGEVARQVQAEIAGCLGEETCTKPR